MNSGDVNAPSGSVNVASGSLNVASVNVVSIVDGNNNENPSVATRAGSGRNVRSRTAAGEAIVDAMLQIAAASRMRADLMKRNEDFSISKCIRLLDQLEGIDQRVYFHALDLFESPTAREIFMSLRDDRKITWLQRKCNAA